MGFQSQQAVEVINTLGQRRNRVIWLICLVEVAQPAAQQLAQPPSTFTAQPGEAISVQYPIALHCLPASFAGRCYDCRGPESYSPERRFRDVDKAEESLDHHGRVVVIMEESGNERQPDRRLLWFGAKIFLADDQFAVNPVQVSLRGYRATTECLCTMLSLSRGILMS